MRCPNCKGEIPVRDTRFDFDENEAYRYRKCKVCGAKVYTVEFEVEHDKKFKAIWRILGKLKQEGRGAEE